jgi:ATP-binding cassette, subfamily B (MDR/TAP), member 1
VNTHRLPSIPVICISDLFLPAGVGMFICTYIYMCIWVYTAEVAAKRIRESYLRSILRQDIAFFDKVGPGEVTTRIQTDTRP